MKRYAVVIALFVLLGLSGASAAVEDALPLTLAGVEGELGETQEEWYRLDVAPEEAGFFTITLDNADESMYLCGATAEGELTGCYHGPGITALNVRLDTGSHHLWIATHFLNDSTYSLRFSPTEQPGPQTVAGFAGTAISAWPVPENGVVRLEAGSRGETWLIADLAEPGLYRIQALGPELVRMIVRDGGLGQVSEMQYGDGQGMRLDNIPLRAGRNYIEVDTLPGTYSLRLLRLGDLPGDQEELPPEPATAEEPARPAGVIVPAVNLQPDSAHPILPGRTYTGTYPGTSWVYYGFSLQNHENVRMTLQPPEGATMAIELGGGVYYMAAESSEPGAPVVLEHWLPAGDYTVSVYFADGLPGWYSLTLELDHPFGDATSDDLRLELQLDHDSVAAFSPYGQTLEATLVLANDSDEDVEVAIQGHATDSRVSFPPLPVTGVPAGAEVLVPLSLQLPADLRDDRPLSFSLAAIDTSGSTATAAAAVTPACSAPLLNPAHWSPVPLALQGYWNVLSPVFGVQAFEDSNAQALTDGRTTPDAPYAWYAGEELTVDLGAEFDIRGTALHPHFGGSPGSGLRSFELAVSADGDTWDTVLTDALTGGGSEQFFSLDAPVTARHVRLTLVDSQQDTDEAGLGEWKILVADAPGSDVNIAASELGGHVVRSLPLLDSGSAWLADPDYGGEPFHQYVYMYDEGTRPEVVIGFHHNRAAALTAIEWHPSPEFSEESAAVTVSVSVTSPLGPWQEVGSLQPHPDELATLEFTKPVWARFVRLQAQEPVPVETYWNWPQQLRMTESSEFPSILSESGLDVQTSHFETMTPPLVDHATAAAMDNFSRESAADLTTSASGTVKVGEHEAWYQVELPDGSSSMSVTVVSGSGAELITRLYGVDGELEYEGTTADGPVTASGQPGDSWLLQIAEPPRNVVFLWDNSGSVSPYENQIYSALETFTRGISSDHEQVRLLVFAEPVNDLMGSWSGDPNDVSSALNEYDRSDSSSDAEAALLAASLLALDQPGSRTIVLITDAESGSYGDSPAMWQAFADSNVAVHALEISSSGSDYAQDYMQDWAMAGNGHYINATTTAELQTGFARSNCLVRHPKEFVASVEFSAHQPEPGSLQVISALTGTESAGVMPGSIEVILDASGSMYRTLDGRYRYEIAKDVLSRLVTDVLPADVPFALRVFGNRQADVCRSDLEVPLSPLDRDAVVSVISGIEPQPFAGTPIADSLAMVMSDLAGSASSGILVLITDGEESCDGDVEAAIAGLRSAGMDVVLNIIGFDFDAEDPEVARARFRAWAELGGGSYHDAGNADELAEALAASVIADPPFEVLDAADAVVATGTVNGSPVDLPAGTYTVRVLAGEAVIFSEVVVDGGEVVLTVE